METNVLNLREHWESAVSHTRTRSPATFDRWFSTVQFDDFAAGVLTLRARDLFVRDWVNEHYLPSLVGYLRFSTGLPIQIAWTIGEIEHPVAPSPPDDPPPSRATRPSRPQIPRPASPAPPPPASPLAAIPLPPPVYPPHAAPQGPAAPHQPYPAPRAASPLAAYPSATLPPGYGLQGFRPAGSPEAPPHDPGAPPSYPPPSYPPPSPPGHYPGASHAAAPQAQPHRPSPGPMRAAPSSDLAATFGATPILAAQGPASAPAPRPAVTASMPAAPPPEGINPKYTFENFVVGPSNELAHAAALASAGGGGGRRYSPLFLCGGTGLGKTHLLQAIAHKVLLDGPHKRIIFVSAERFTNEFIAAIQNKRMEAFRAHFRFECDLLLVDDIQFLAGREQTQEEFFHTFNALYELDRPIVFTSDKYPQQLERMEERLISRFSWGLVADVQAPELETRVAILRKKAQVEGIILDDAVALFLAQTVSSNVRELEGTLIRLAAKASLTNRPIDLAFTQGELSTVGDRRGGKTTSVEDIQRAVCAHFHLKPTDLLSKDRHKTTAFARHVAMYLSKQLLPVSFPELGRAFGKDHTTVMSAVRKVEALRERDAQVRGHLEALEKRLGGG